MAGTEMLALLGGNPFSAAITAAGAGLSFLGARQARRARERARQAALAGLAPIGEEASIRQQLLAEARRGAAGVLPPGLEDLARRQEALSTAEAARFGEIARADLARRLGAAGLLGSAAGAAAEARRAAEEGRAADALRLARERELFGAAQTERARGLGLLQSIAAQLAQERLARAQFEAGAPVPDEASAAGGALTQAGIENLLQAEAERRAAQQAADLQARLERTMAATAVPQSPFVSAIDYLTGVPAGFGVTRQFTSADVRRRLGPRQINIG